jgi:uncharacterized protein
MYAKDGEQYYIVDGHTHFWNAGADNRNRHGEGFIECFYGYHSSLSPEEWLWPKEKFDRYTEQDIIHDLFEVGYVDKAIFLPTYLKDFFPAGFNTIEQNAAIAEKHPDRFIVNGAFDPRDGEEGLKRLERDHDRYGIRGVKLYTAEWKGNSKGYRLDDPATYRYLDKCVELGVTNIHIHKGPTIWPFNKDAFDVGDVDDVATMYRDSGLNFIVEHCGIPRIEDFCWIAAQEPNVYGGLAVVMPFIYASPHYFAEVMGELMFWLGPDRLLFSSDYALWSPKWIVEKFMAWDFPDDVKANRGVSMTTENKKKIMGLNAAKLYGLAVPSEAGFQVAVPA